MNSTSTQKVSGQFVNLGEDRFYKIAHVDQMPPFFISLISHSDHWLFAASNGGLTAGRISPETALFPYVTVDKIYESTPHTGCKTLLKVKTSEGQFQWEPFNVERFHTDKIERNLYKSVLGDVLVFEEINLTLNLSFTYRWSFSEEFGFCRDAKVTNLRNDVTSIEVIDGLTNLLPAGTPRFTQTQSSNLVDAYKFSELDADTGLGIFSLYSGITDRAEPSESLRANTVFCLGLENTQFLLSEQQLKHFRLGQNVITESHCRGMRGAYLVHSKFELAANGYKTWKIIANVEQDQTQIVALLSQLNELESLATALNDSIKHGHDQLARIMASSDGMQCTEEENVSVHHYANTLFNVLRGGIFNDQYRISAEDFSATIKSFNKKIYQNHQDFLQNLPQVVSVQELHTRVEQQNDTQLLRLTLEYLPITFGRRHGDPSRPWNQFAIELKDKQGNPLLSYQGNWRDIFQNWEALTFSYPEFIESVIAKFVNASTMDGYNPYRITKQGIDWEVEEPDDPWSYIGYWGDHQIIYLLKMLELSEQFHPQTLTQLLFKPVFCYANVPYRIKPFEELVKDAKSTVLYDEKVAANIDEVVETLGADGKLILTPDNEVYQVNLLEKLLVPLLTKLSNLVIDGGIWLNTQRPEWNDANNALVGQGLSMVTLYYMRRYIAFMQNLIATQSGTVELSSEVAHWLETTASALQTMSKTLEDGPVTSQQSLAFLQEIGRLASDYRQQVYANNGFADKTTLECELIKELLASSMSCIEHSIKQNQGDDGLYHAYNLLAIKSDELQVKHLYPMLEGQVAALSSGAIKGQQAVDVLEALFESDVYRDDQNTFMLYPDRKQTPFLRKNVIPSESIASIPVVAQMLSDNDMRLLTCDARGDHRFNADIKNAGDLADVLAQLKGKYGQSLEQSIPTIMALYESVFQHAEFTGRSGGMFGFEGLGSVYWHMVSKLLLAVKEQFFWAIEDGQDLAVIHRLGELYYKVRHGIGFNKTPEEYGAFPTDPYSHTPKHAGAQQPGMTGQVKEEVLTRFGELGLQVNKGKVSIVPKLLRQREFRKTDSPFYYLDVSGEWQLLNIEKNCLGFTWCQVPFIYSLNDDEPVSITVFDQGQNSQCSDELALTQEQANHLFNRTGQILKVVVNLNSHQLFGQ